MVEKMHISMLAAAVVGGACYTAYYYGTDYTSPQCLQSLLTNVYLWAAVLAVLGCAKAWFDRQTPATRYLSASSFGYYILHYPVLIVTCYVLHTCFSLPAIWNYLIAFVVELGLTAVLYELLKRVPGLVCRTGHQKFKALRDTWRKSTSACPWCCFIKHRQSKQTFSVPYS